MLDKWVDAKRAKDFREADRIREDLRAQGIEPEHHRPDRKREDAMSGYGFPPPAQMVQVYGHAGPGMHAYPMHAPAMSMGPQVPPAGSWWAEARLDEWVEAKRAKDFKAADSIRDELRDRGIQPDMFRPKGWVQTVFPPSGSNMNEALLDEWVEAKRAKDFQRADEIRDDLRSHGVEPDQARPDMLAQQRRGGGGKGGGKDFGGARGAPAGGWGPGAHGPASYDGGQGPSKRAKTDSGRGNRKGGRKDEEIESMLDEWVEAKRGKDYATADRIRDELRDRGVEPEQARPKR
jgi:cysteinyl-tRNA synthetase